jgi:hypothetical protein
MAELREKNRLALCGILCNFPHHSHRMRDLMTRFSDIACETLAIPVIFIFGYAGLAAAAFVDRALEVGP